MGTTPQHKYLTMVLPRAATSSVAAPLMRAAAVRSAVAQNARMAAQRYQLAGAQQQQTRQASHAAELHGHEQQQQYPSEGFHGAFWRNTILAIVLGFATYRLSIRHAPALQDAAIDATHDPEGTPVEAADQEKPWITRYLAHHMPREGLWKERNAKHLELSLAQAEDKLLVQDAKRPLMKRIFHSVELASPHGLQVGNLFVPDANSTGKDSKNDDKKEDDEESSED